MHAPRHRIAVLGGEDVGKTALCLQVSHRPSGTILLIIAKLIKEEFDYDAHTPSGEDCWQISVQVDDGWRHVEIWDIGGQLEVLQLQLIDNAEEFVVVYDTTSRSSFQRVVYFLHAVRLRYPHAPMVLVGSKVDKEGDRRVLPAEGQSLAWEFQCDFTEVHARDHLKVKRLFLQGLQSQTAEDQRLGTWTEHSPEIMQKWCEIWRSLYHWCLAGCWNPR